MQSQALSSSPVSEASIRPDHESQTIRITDFAVTDDVIAGRSFSNCLIIGPAVLAPLDDNEFNSCTFDLPDGQGPESLILDVGDQPRWLVGVVGLRGCRFYQCRFVRIGFAMPPATAHQFLTAVRGS